tara:strand:+ start:87 stop:899 length:813 start_codon:yes stop_codon:yes gene_type:complete
MISLKRNTKKELIKARGIRVMKKFIYEPNQKEDFKISRGKFEDFLKCERCFYLDRVGGLEVPKFPAFTLNDTTDKLYKKEFDFCREKQKPHRLLIENNLSHIIPYQHEDIDKWRDSLQHGLMIRYKNTNIILTGGVDDVWFNTKNEKLVVIDYKSQAKEKKLLNTQDYLDDVFHQSYKNQLEFYSYLLNKMGFEVDETGYFVVCNADRSKENFEKVMSFDELLVPYKLDTSWIETKLDYMIRVLNKKIKAKSNESCMNCAYQRERKKIEN